jgi:stearoyl-CoA desaturase (delta-9 desaturase)
LGDKTYSDLHTAFDSVVTAVLSMLFVVNRILTNLALGEGYHNYHHEFPSDYRNGIKFYHYDPTKWLITGLSYLGLTYNLKMINNGEIEKAKLQMHQRTLNVERAKLQLGKNFNDLSNMTWEEFQSQVSKGQQLVVIDNIVHDVSEFVHDHPGGRQTLLNYVGTDATNFFEGQEGYQKHAHSKEARKYPLCN